MKILLINGSPHQEGCTHTALSSVAETLAGHAIDTEEVWVGHDAIAGCIACEKCRRDGRCIHDDMVSSVAEKIGEYDGIIVGSPVYYAGASGQVTAFMDRLFYMCGSKMAGKVAAAVVSCRRGGASTAFDAINKYFLMSNMYVVGSQYWNQVHGTTAAEAVRDEEGMQTMRTLGENMAYLLRALRVARLEGIPLPSYEAKVRTNFIRE